MGTATAAWTVSLEERSEGRTHAGDLVKDDRDADIMFRYRIDIYG